MRSGRGDERGELVLDRQVGAGRHGDDALRRRRWRRRASVAYGTASRSTPALHTTVGRRPRRSSAMATHGTSSLTFAAGDRRVGGDHRARPRSAPARPRQAGAQRTAAGQAVERVTGGAAARGAGATEATNSVRASAGRLVAVEQLERLAIVGADADLQPVARPCPASVTAAAHLQPADLADEHAVLDHRRRPGGDDQLAERVVLGGQRPAGRRAVRRSPAAACARRRATPRSAGRTRRPPGEHAGGRLGDELQLGGVVADRPGDRRTRDRAPAGRRPAPTPASPAEQRGADAELPRHGTDVGGPVVTRPSVASFIARSWSSRYLSRRRHDAGARSIARPCGRATRTSAVRSDGSTWSCARRSAC